MWRCYAVAGLLAGFGLVGLGLGQESRGSGIQQASKYDSRDHQRMLLDSQRQTDEALPFTIGLLAPWNASFGDFSALTSASAVSIAIEKVRAHPVWSKRVNLRWVSKFQQLSA